tara:strand:- start:227106 stop:227435 length:330 start_codon:yes stop_codon:yes gene_type:complete
VKSSENFNPDRLEVSLSSFYYPVTFKVTGFFVLDQWDFGRAIGIHCNYIHKNTAHAVAVVAMVALAKVGLGSPDINRTEYTEFIDRLILLSSNNTSEMHLLLSIIDMYL